MFDCVRTNVIVIDTTLEVRCVSRIKRHGTIITAHISFIWIFDAQGATFFGHVNLRVVWFFPASLSSWAELEKAHFLMKSKFRETLVTAGLILARFFFPMPSALGPRSPRECKVLLGYANIWHL